jgi:prepilin-type N-terminal cleavage/methylation domain-containing protein
VPMRTIPARSGFTLIELMVVMAIIAVLVTFAVGTAFHTIKLSREKATSGLLTKINGLLQARIDGIARKDLEGPVFQGRIVANLAVAGGNARLAEVYARKQIAKLRLPQTWEEVHDAKLITDAEYTNLQNEMTAATSGTGSLIAESSEVLYFILTGSNAIGYVDQGVDFTSQEVANTGCTSRPEFVDAWGNPLRFYRWPTRLLRPNGVANGMPDPGFPMAFDEQTTRLLMPTLPAGGTTTRALRTDPDDPTFQLDSIPMPMQFEDSYSTISTYSVPLVVSAGADEILGIEEPNVGYGRLARLVDPLDRLPVTDNITNWNAR